MKPIIVVNFKCYDNATGKNGLKLAAYCSTYDNVIVCSQAIDIDNISTIPGLTVYAQHVDPLFEGAYTGYMSISAIKKAGAKGSLLNHPEHRVEFDLLKKTVEMMAQTGLKSIVCTSSIEEAERFAKLRPDYISYEPKELIGAKQSIAAIDPGMIERVAKAVRPVRLLVGAGIHSPSEVREILNRGAIGVLVSSSVVKSEDPRKIIRELAEA